MRILIIDDEFIFAEQLKWCISTVKKECTFLPFAGNLRESMELVATTSPDVVFMDAELSHDADFDTFRKTIADSSIVFTLSNEQYKYSPLETSLTYLLKPAQENMIEKAFNEIENRKAMMDTVSVNTEYRPESSMVPLGHKSRFLVKHGQKLIPVKATEINHFSYEDKLTHLITVDKRKYIVDESLNELELLLNPTDFFRVSRKFIVAKDSILSLDYYSKGQVAVKALHLENERIIVSRQQTPLLKMWLSH